MKNHLLKRTLGFLLWGGLCFGLLQPVGVHAATPNKIAPDFHLATLDGKEVSLQDYKGKYLMLNFWATWCGPCKIEMPSLEALYQRFKSDQFEILAISNDLFGKQVVEPYVESNEMTFPVLLDPQGRASKSYQINSLPTTVLINPDSRVIGVLIGAENWSKPDTMLYFEDLLSKQPSNLH